MVGPETGSYTAKKSKSDRFLLDPVQGREREKGVGGRAIDVLKLGKRRRSRQATDVYEGGVNAMGECDTLKDRNCCNSNKINGWKNYETYLTTCSRKNPATGSTNVTEGEPISFFDGPFRGWRQNFGRRAVGGTSGRLPKSGRGPLFLRKGCWPTIVQMFLWRNKMLIWYQKCSVKFWFDHFRVARSTSHKIEVTIRLCCTHLCLFFWRNMLCTMRCWYELTNAQENKITDYYLYLISTNIIVN